MVGLLGRAPRRRDRRQCLLGASQHKVGEHPETKHLGRHPEEGHNDT